MRLLVIIKLIVLTLLMSCNLPDSNQRNEHKKHQPETVSKIILSESPSNRWLCVEQSIKQMQHYFAIGDSVAFANQTVFPLADLQGLGFNYASRDSFLHNFSRIFFKQARDFVTGLKLDELKRKGTVSKELYFHRSFEGHFIRKDKCPDLIEITLLDNFSGFSLHIRTSDEIDPETGCIESSAIFQFTINKECDFYLHDVVYAG